MICSHVILRVKDTARHKQTDKELMYTHMLTHRPCTSRDKQTDWTLLRTDTVSPHPMVVSKQVQSSPWKPSFTRAILCSSACLARSGTGPLAAFESAPWLLGSELLVCESLPDCCGLSGDWFEEAALIADCAADVMFADAMLAAAWTFADVVLAAASALADALFAAVVNCLASSVIAESPACRTSNENVSETYIKADYVLPG